jgi:hypothetical protein
MVIFGGWDMPTVFDDCFLFDMTLLEFSKLEPTGGVSPGKRSRCTGPLGAHTMPICLVSLVCWIEHISVCLKWCLTACIGGRLHALVADCMHWWLIDVIRTLRSISTIPIIQHVI